MLYVALLIGVLALFLAWRSSRAVRDLKERSDRLSSQLYGLRLDMHRAAEEHQQAIMQLRFELMRHAGDLKVTRDMTVDEERLRTPNVQLTL